MVEAIESMLCWIFVSVLLLSWSFVCCLIFHKAPSRQLLISSLQPLLGNDGRYSARSFQNLNSSYRYLNCIQTRYEAGSSEFYIPKIPNKVGKQCDLRESRSSIFELDKPLFPFDVLFLISSISNPKSVHETKSNNALNVCLTIDLFAKQRELDQYRFP